MTVALATTGLVALEPEEVCEVVEASICFGTIVESPLNGWTPWGSPDSSMRCVHHASHGHGGNQTSAIGRFGSANETTGCSPEFAVGDGEYFSDHQFNRAATYAFGFFVASIFWTRHAVATRHVSRGPTFPLMIIHVLLLVSMGTTLFVGSLGFAITDNASSKYQLDHNTTVADPNKGSTFATNVMSPLSVLLGVWSISMGILEICAIVWEDDVDGGSSDAKWGVLVIYRFVHAAVIAAFFFMFGGMFGVPDNSPDQAFTSTFGFTSLSLTFFVMSPLCVLSSTLVLWIATQIARVADIVIFSVELTSVE
jgi:hypothetical protein